MNKPARQPTTHSESRLHIIPDYISLVLQNLALGKPARQSSTYPGGAASKGVDDNVNGHWSGGSCTHTWNNPQPAWWEVNLEDVKNISKVNIKLLMFSTVYSMLP